MKKTGLSLIIVIIKLFSKSIERIGDDDEDSNN
jgi:hypothetical protein